MTFDVGSNLTFLGILFLFLKYLLPTILLILLLGALFLLLRHLHGKLLLDAPTPQILLYTIIAVGILLIFLLR